MSMVDELTIRLVITYFVHCWPKTSFSLGQKCIPEMLPRVDRAVHYFHWSAAPFCCPPPHLIVWRCHDNPFLWCEWWKSSEGWLAIAKLEVRLGVTLWRRQRLSSETELWRVNLLTRELWSWTRSGRWSPRTIQDASSWTCERHLLSRLKYHRI